MDGKPGRGGVGPAVVWFRRDLRLHDHPALSAALIRSDRVAPLFVVDPALARGQRVSPNRWWYMLATLQDLAEALGERGSHLSVRLGDPRVVVPAFARSVDATDVYASRELLPYGRRRDRAVADILERQGVAFHHQPGTVIHEPEEVLTAGGKQFGVFTPFLRRWEAIPFRPILPAPDVIPTVSRSDNESVLTAAEIAHSLRIPGPTASIDALLTPGEQAARARLEAWLAAGPLHGPAGYARTRDRLDDDAGTSRLGPDLRFGLVSPTEVATRALAVDDRDASRRFVTELAWRDFYAHTTWHEPRVSHEAFQHQYVDARWPGGSMGDVTVEQSSAIDAWRSGMTGYPVVDAAMRQLVATGFMSNRARMIVASFLTKDLLVEWRIGEAHFMRHLVDGDPASNGGGWQWSASVGTDAAPYFRVFNPVTQGRRFDPDGTYVRRWVPELRAISTAQVHEPWTLSAEAQVAAGCIIGTDYPAPIVDHAAARQRAIAWHAAR